MTRVAAAPPPGPPVERSLESELADTVECARAAPPSPGSSAASDAEAAAPADGPPGPGGVRAPEAPELSAGGGPAGQPRLHIKDAVFAVGEALSQHQYHVLVGVARDALDEQRALQAVRRSHEEARRELQQKDRLLAESDALIELIQRLRETEREDLQQLREETTQQLQGQCDRIVVLNGCVGGGGGGGGGWRGAGGQGCIRRGGASEAAPEAVRQAVGGGCQSGWGTVTVGYQCH